MTKSSKAEHAGMVSTRDLLDLLKDKLGSDYKTAKELNVPTQRIYKLRHQGGSLTDEQGLKAAEILNFPAEFIILSLAAERSFNSPAYDLLVNITDKFDPRKTASIAAFAVIAAGLLNEGILAQLTSLSV